MTDETKNIKSKNKQRKMDDWKRGESTRLRSTRWRLNLDGPGNRVFRGNMKESG